MQWALCMIRSASRKLRNRLATSRSWRKSFWNSGRGSVFQAMVSVMAVKIQFSSPRSVFRSLCFPGIRSIRLAVIPSSRRRLPLQKTVSAILMGVVRHAVKTSAGRSWLCGSVSCALQEARRIVSCIARATSSASFGTELPGG